MRSIYYTNLLISWIQSVRPMCHLVCMFPSGYRRMIKSDQMRTPARPGTLSLHACVFLAATTSLPMDSSALVIMRLDIESTIDGPFFCDMSQRARR